eukprot:UN06748
MNFLPIKLGGNFCEIFLHLRAYDYLSVWYSYFFSISEDVSFFCITDSSISITFH